MRLLMSVLLLVLATTSHAGPSTDPEPEEIIVYGDDFARWDDTRWLVQAELIVPEGIELVQDNNQSFTTYMFQIRSVLKCSKDRRLNKKKWEVDCVFEDVGLLTTSLRRAKRERDRKMVQEVLDEIDAKLTGLRVQLQTDFKGGVTNVDLEGVEARNLRQRRSVESLRQAMSRMVAGFHLRIPDHAQREGEWLEYRSALMSMPSTTASSGNSVIKHVVSPRSGIQIVQTIGAGTTSVNLRRRVLQDARTDPGTVNLPSSDPSGEATDFSLAEPDSQFPGQAVSDDTMLPATYDMSVTGVAIFEKSTGIMTERVWTVHGSPTASAGSDVQLPPYKNVGRIQMLGANDRPNVGSSRQVALPGKEIEGLDPWISLESIE